MKAHITFAIAFHFKKKKKSVIYAMFLGRAVGSSLQQKLYPFI